MSSAETPNGPATDSPHRCLAGARDSGSLSLLRGNPPHLYVPNPGAYYAIREAVSLNRFKSSDESPWPTAQVNRGNAVGHAQLMPPGIEQNGFTSPERRAELAEKMCLAAANLSDSDADVLDLLNAAWIDQAKKPADSAVISIDQILAIRGLKPKRGAGGRRSGYRENQRAAVCMSIEFLENLWVTLSRLDVYSSNQKTTLGIKQTISVQSRVVIITDRITREHPDGRRDLLQFAFRPGTFLGQFLLGTRRQIALLALSAIQYDPHREKFKKRLARYFSWQWRIRSCDATYLTPFCIKTLLDAVGVDISRTNRPARIRDRLETALEALEDDGVIKTWQYQSFDADMMSWPNWLQIWFNAKVVIEPPDVITTTYLSIARPQISAPLSASAAIGQRVRSMRLQRNLSLLVAAQEIGIDPTLLSRIENGVRRPSRLAQRKLETWLREFDKP